MLKVRIMLFCVAKPESFISSNSQFSKASFLLHLYVQYCYQKIPNTGIRKRERVDCFCFRNVLPIKPFSSFE